MRKRPARSTPIRRSASRTRRTDRQPMEIEELRRRLADAEAELEFYRNKQEWLQSALATQRHARQVLEASVSATYDETVERIREVVDSVIPHGATVLVVSRGDMELLKLDGQRAWHFPQNEEGEYAGYYPVDSSAAIAHLQSLIDKGAEYLLLPNTAFWWLEHYRGLEEWLGAFHTSAWRDERCAIYKLSRTRAALPPETAARAELGPTCTRQNGNPGAGSLAPGVGASQTARPNPEGAFPDVLCFPIIDWDFRFQRPQQLMLQFAKAGRRVFYLSHQFRKSGQRYLLRSRAASLWEVFLRGPRFSPHQGLLDEIYSEDLANSLSALRASNGMDAAVAFVQAPFWWPLVKRVMAEFEWPVVYDCMDYHAGFPASNPLLVEQEGELMRAANLVIASSSNLESAARRYNQHVLLVRNGCDYEHFSKIAPKPIGPRPVIGYYGAISDWFDSDLVANLVQQRPDWDFILVGSTVSANVSRLARLPNVMLAGEKDYKDIPEWLAKFDVALLPFKRTPLTEAVNPVKAYEILAAGKPLVSVPLPEMLALGHLVRLASTPEEFRRQIEAELAAQASPIESQRRLFAKENTWQKRFEALLPEIIGVVRRRSSSTRTCLRFRESRAQACL